MTNGVASTRTKEFYEKLTVAARQQVTGVSPVLMVPCGHVLFELDKLAKAGQLPGFSSARGFYADDTHLNDKGCYVVGCALYSVVFREKPEGFPHAAYGVSDAAAPVIQNAAWQVATSNELCGVGSPTCAALSAARLSRSAAGLVRCGQRYGVDGRAVRGDKTPRGVALSAAAGAITLHAGR